MTKEVFVKDITRENVEVHDLFVVAKKGIYSSKNNTRYMSITLRDKTGSIEGKVWDEVDRLAQGFERNDVVLVRARTRFFQDRPQLTVTSIEKVENVPLAGMADFFQGPDKDLSALREQYFSMVKELTGPPLRRLFESFHRREDRLERFLSYPASIGVHHVYVGGLIDHSLSVAAMGRETWPLIGGDRDLIIAGSLLHDIGKIEEIEFKGGFRYTDQGRLLGHITLGIRILDSLVAETEGFPKEAGDVLRHIIVSHHGMEEWGSPRKPMCVEALAVHYLDNLDAKVMGVREHMRDNMEDERWSEYHRLYESRFYRYQDGTHGD